MKDRNTQTRSRRELSSPDKGHLQKAHSSSSIIAKVECFSAKIRIKKRTSTLVTSIQHCTIGSSQKNQAR